MAQFSVKIIRLNGAVLDENQHPDRFAASFHKALRDIWKQTMARP